MKDIEKILVKPADTIEETVAAIQLGSVGIALVVDDNGRLLGTITDGDIRRAILNKIPLSSGVGLLLENRHPDYTKPTALPASVPHQQILKLMEEKVLRQIPLLDESGRVVELALMGELVEETDVFPAIAVIMAGGKGKRLRPLTKDIPKPMLPLDNSPLMEKMIQQLKKSGITEIYITTNYKSEVIKNHFGSGEKFSVSINYIHETRPLGTAGALSLISPSEKATLVINGDILTQLNFRTMYDFHVSNSAVMTVGVRLYEFDIPYGVIEMDDIHIKNITEKPLRTCVVNAGIYMLSPKAYSYIPKHRRFNMTDLVEKLIKNKQKVISFPIQEYWMDIGHLSDYERAKVDLQNGKF